ncbi:B3/4 domain-containing protein [Acidobacteriota bacterium]
MKFSVHSNIFDRFPGLILGAIVVSGIDNRKQSTDLQMQIRDIEQDIQQNYESETLSVHPNIQAWRSAYSKFGAKPKKYKSSIESLLRMILKGIELKSINMLVDIYNYVSLKHKIPLGGDDLDKVEGDITLCFACGDEPFTPINSIEAKTVNEGEVIYKDEKEVLCRRWNWRECDKTKMTPETKNAVLVLEGLPPVRREDIESAAENLSALVQKFCGGEARKFILDVSRQETYFSFSPQ